MGTGGGVSDGQAVICQPQPGETWTTGAGEDLICSDASVMKVAFLRMFQEIVVD
jgi:hypothetical protein